MNKDVSKQDHYARFEIEPIEFITKNNLSYNQGNIIKYACRYPYKHKDVAGKLQDLEKVKVYADYCIRALGESS